MMLIIKMSLNDVLYYLGIIRELVSLSFVGEKGKPQDEVQLGEMDETQEKLFDIVKKLAFSIYAKIVYNPLQLSIFGFSVVNLH